PGATVDVALARRLAGGARRIGHGIEKAIVSAKTVDRIFKRALARLDHAAAAHARHAAGIFLTRRHLALQPADGRHACGAREREAPGAATSIVLTSRRASRRVAVAHREVCVIAAATVVADLRRRRTDASKGDKGNAQELDPI